VSYSRFNENSDWYIWSDVDNTLHISPSNKVKIGNVTKTMCLTKEQSIQLYETLKCAIEDKWWENDYDF